MRNKTELIGLLRAQAWIPSFEGQITMKILRIVFVLYIVIESMWVNGTPRLSRIRSRQGAR